MTRAIVIKTVGDMEMSGAIMDGMTKVIPLDNGELALVKQEYAKLQARDAVRSYGDSVRWESVSGALAVKYATPRHGRLYEAILGAWALLWMGIYEAYDRLSAINREA